MLPLRLSFSSMHPTIVLSFPHGAEPAFTLPGVDPRAAVIPITRLVIDLLATATDVALDRATISTVVGRRRCVGTALTPTLLSPFIGHLEGAGPDPSLGRPSRLLGFDVGFEIFTIGHSPSLLHQFVVQAHEPTKHAATVRPYRSISRSSHCTDRRAIRSSAAAAACWPHR